MMDKLRDQIDWRIRVFDSLSFPTLILRPDRTIVSVNKKFLEKIGAREADVVGQTCRNFFIRYDYDPELPCSKEQCPLDKTLKDGCGHSVLRQVKGKDGEIRWEDRHLSPILDENGSVIYVIESVRDVTQTKTLESMYYNISEYLEKIIQSSPSAIVAADRQGKILLMNEAAETLFGCTIADTESITAEDLYPPGVAREIMAKMRDDEFGGRGKLQMTELNIVDTKGEEIPVELTAAVIYKTDHEVASMGIFNDLRERRAVENRLQEAERKVLQSEKMASLGRLAAGVAHEINNPLTGILMYGNMTLERLTSQDPVRKNLQYVLEDCERCRDIVKNLLAYSRQTNPSQEVFALSDMVEESLGLIRDQKLFMNIRIDKQISNGDLCISADRNQMQQVVINLVMNALDAMDGEGVLTLRTFPDPRKNRAVLEVSDTGKGIPESDRTRVFDPFFTTKALGSGTGLGLSTVYGIVKENNGNIQLTQADPGRTTFRVEMPLFDAQNEKAPVTIG